MTVAELKELISDLPDDMEVVCPSNSMEFDGVFYSPCVLESGSADLGLEDLDDEEIKERNLLNQPIKEEKSFVLVPCGFFEEPQDDEPDPQMN